MMWILAGLYCLVLWLVFDKYKLMRLSLPVAIVVGSVGPILILVFLFCAQYYHPYSGSVHSFQKVVPIVPQLKQAGRVTKVSVEPNTPINQGEILFEIDPLPFQKAVDRLTASVSEAEQAVPTAEGSVALAQATIKRTEADLEFMAKERDRMQGLVEQKAISQEEYEGTLAKYQQASSAMEQSKVSLKQAELSVESAKAKLAQVQASLDDAKYDLEQTQVRAPSSGFVTNLQLQPGMLVGGPGATPVMSFVQERTQKDQGVVVAMVGQKNFLLIEQGNSAEVVLDAYPGEVLTGKVENVIEITGAGQLTASGDLPADIPSSASTQFAVRIKLDAASQVRLPAGASGVAAVYTNHVPIATIPVMFVIRMQSWLNYVM